MSASSENKLPQLNYFDPRGPQSSFDEVSFLVAVICTWSFRVIGKSRSPGRGAASTLAQYLFE